MQQSSKRDGINIMCLKKAMATNRPKPSEGKTCMFLMYVLPGGRETGTVRQEKNNHPDDPSAHITTARSQTQRFPIGVFRFSGKEKNVGERKLPPLLVHPLTSICAITPFDTWFHVTRWPTGWTTKTRNRGNRYK